MTIRVPTDVDKTERLATLIPFKYSNSDQIERANTWAYGKTVTVNIEPSMEISIKHTGNTFTRYPHITSLSIFASNSQPQIIKNEITSGFRILSKKTAHVISPDNFILQISQNNVNYLIQHCTIVNGTITTPCIWGEHNNEMFLLSTTSPHYTKAIAYTNKLKTKVDIDDVAVGDVVDLINESIFENNQICTYVGKYWFAFLKINRTDPTQPQFQISQTYLNVFSTKASMFVIHQPNISRIVEKNNLLNQQPASITKIKNAFRKKLRHFYNEIGPIDQLLHIDNNIINNATFHFGEESINTLQPIDFKNNWPMKNKKRIIPILTFTNNEKYIVYEMQNRIYMKQIEFINKKLVFPPKTRSQRRIWLVDSIKLDNATISRLQVMYNDIEIHLDPKVLTMV